MIFPNSMACNQKPLLPGPELPPAVPSWQFFWPFLFFCWLHHLVAKVAQILPLQNFRPDVLGVSRASGLPKYLLGGGPFYPPKHPNTTRSFWSFWDHGWLMVDFGSHRRRLGFLGFRLRGEPRGLNAVWGSGGRVPLGSMAVGLLKDGDLRKKIETLSKGFLRKTHGAVY